MLKMLYSKCTHLKSTKNKIIDLNVAWYDTIKYYIHIYMNINKYMAVHEYIQTVYPIGCEYIMRQVVLINGN